MPTPRKGSVLVLVGTRKGAFLLSSDARRRSWRVDGPHFPGRNVHHFTLDPRDSETLFATIYTEWWGSDVQRSRNWGRTWQGARGGVRYPKNSGLSVKCVWHVRPGRHAEPGVVYCGVDPAGLFRSEDGGITWDEMRGLNRHASRKRWTPGAGGLIAHTILLDPSDPRRMYVAISAAGVFRSDDSGRTWQPRNRGTRADFLPKKLPEVGQCVHRLSLAPGVPGLLYQQNHCGVYRSDTAGDSWTDISRGLPSRFGFPIAVHPRDPKTLWVLPLISDQMRTTPGGCLAVYRSTTGGRSWRKQTRGLPTRNAHAIVLRAAMSTDSCDPAGVYVGTQGGQLFGSRDEGRSWSVIAGFLPPILSVEAFSL